MRFAAKLGGNGPFRQGGERRDRNHSPVVGRHEDTLKIARIVHRVRGRYKANVKAVVVDKKRADSATVKHRLERLAQTVNLDAQVLGAGTVDFHKKLRLRCVIAKPYLPEPRVGFHPFDQGTCDLGQLAIVVADQRHRQPLTRAPDAQRIGLDRNGAHADHPLQTGADLCRDLLLASGPGGPVRQRHHDKAAVGLPAHPGDCKDAFHLFRRAQRLDQRLDLAHLAVGIVQRHALRGLNRKQHDCPILDRRKFLSQRGGAGHGQCSEKRRPRQGDERRRKTKPK